MLGYMHMTFAFGWFLLIVIGKIESMVYHTSAFNPPYFAIFFRYFHPAKETFPYSETFAFLMDTILLFLLIGILLAVTKRFYSALFGMKKTTNQKPYDLLILTVLWLIFPVRFLAESFTSGTNGAGSYITYNAGNFFCPVSSGGTSLLCGVVDLLLLARAIFSASPVLEIHAHSHGNGLYFPEKLGNKTREEIQRFQ